jgi:chemotaxis protein CheY-P-specific phosphatase CheC
MARSIPDGWDVDISFGYQTMEVIREEDLPCLVIVVSGDVQAQARDRMLALGAIDFIRKPIDNEKLTHILSSYGIYDGKADSTATHVMDDDTSDEDKLDACREMVNVAMGRAGENLAELLGEFIDLPIPNVHLIESNELSMAVADINRNEQVSAVSKGFVSEGISGEALVIFSDTNSQNIVELLKYPPSDSPANLALEALMDVSNILIGACLNGLSEQLNVQFNHTHPVLLGQHKGLSALLSDNVHRWGKLMAIEIGYAIKARDISFDLLLLFPGDAINQLYTRLLNDDKDSL